MAITRRQFGTTLAAGSLAATLPARFASAQAAAIKLKYGTAFPADHPGTLALMLRKLVGKDRNENEVVDPEYHLHGDERNQSRPYRRIGQQVQQVSHWEHRLLGGLSVLENSQGHASSTISVRRAWNASIRPPPHGNGGSSFET